MKKAVLLAIVATLTACSSSGPLQVGQDTYMITKRSAGGLMTPGVTVKADIIKEANEFCGKSGKQTELVSSDAKNAIPFARTSSAEITFKCV